MSTQRFPDRVKGRTVLLVAGTGGIGFGVASALMSNGANIILTSTGQNKLDNCIESLKETYPEYASNVRGYVLDLKSKDVEANLEHVFAQIEKDGVTQLNHLMYFAGDPLAMVPIEDVTLKAWQDASQVRTISALLTAKYAVKLLRASPNSADCSPSITYTGGAISEKPIAGGWSMTSMMGAGLNALARQLALDLAPIRVNTVAPGAVHTELWKDMDEDTKQGMFKHIEENMPTRRLALPYDVAEAYLYLMKDGNITGQVIHTNSGSFLV